MDSSEEFILSKRVSELSAALLMLLRKVGAWENSSLPTDKELISATKRFLAE